MPFWNFRGKREANIIHSEIYKDVIKDFLSLKGYRQYANSSIEGCLSDLILKNPELDGEIETHVEAKWSNFSLNEGVVRKEFIEYFLLYLRTPIKKKFKFFIFARNVQNKTFHQNIFEKYRTDKIEEYCKKIESELEDKNLMYFKNIDLENKIEFFYSTTLIQTDISDLKLKIAEITGNYPIKTDPSVRYQHIEENLNLDDSEDILISNLIELKNFKKLWIAKSNINDPREIKEKVEHHPPYQLYEGKIISLYPFEDYNPLNDIIDQTTIEQEQVKNWIDDENKRRVLISLLNRTGKKLCQLHGLYRKQESYIYYFPDLELKEEKSLEWIKFERINQKIQKRNCNRIIFKKFFKNSFNPYYLHIAVNLQAVYFDKKLFYCLLPAKVFTNNGTQEVPSIRAKKLDEYFRNPQFSYNRNLLLEQLFWGYILFLNPEIRQKHLFYPNQRIEEIEYHTQMILKLLGLDYFKEFILKKKPKIQEVLSEEAEELNTIFNFTEEYSRE